MPDNDNDDQLETPASRPVDAHGHAALILVESLLHGLIDRSILTTGQSLEIVTAAAEVQAAYADEADDARHEMRRSHVLLTGIADSMRIDFPTSVQPTLIDTHDGSQPLGSSPGTSAEGDGIDR